METLELGGSSASGLGKRRLLGFQISSHIGFRV